MPIDSFEDDDQDNSQAEYMDDRVNEVAFDDAEDEDEVGHDRDRGRRASQRSQQHLPSSNTSTKAGKESGGAKNCFYAGLMSGAIFYLKDNGSSEEVLTAGSSIKHLLLKDSLDVLIVMTEAFIMGQFKIDSMGALHEMNKASAKHDGFEKLYVN